jgi:D-hydroxyproline dehydrogenase
VIAKCKLWIIGSGIVGLCVAHELVRRQVPVGIVSAHWGEERASYGNAGHIAVEQVETLADPRMLKSLPSRLFSRGGPAAFPIRDLFTWLPFGLKYIRRSTPSQFSRNSVALETLMNGALGAWQQLALNLGDSALLKTNGHYVAYESKRTAARGSDHWQNANLGMVSAEPLDINTLRLIEGSLHATLHGGVRFVGSGQVQSPPLILDRLESALQSQGVEFRTAEVKNITKDADTFKLLLRDSSAIDASAVVIAAGARSHELLKPFNLKIPLIAERGYHLEGPVAGTWDIDGPVVFEDRHVVVSRFNDRLRATSFVEFAHHRSPPDLRKWQRLNRHLEELGIPMGGPRIPWMGARPTLPDYLPALGQTRHVPGLWTAFGHQHLGLTLAPITARYLAQMICGEKTMIDLSPFSVDRF